MEAITAERPVGRLSSTPRRLLAGLRGLIACVIVLAAVFAGVGVLYLIRELSPLAVGPQISGALPLQQLAGGESQPLLRLAVAWVPAGFVAGIALESLTGLGPRARVGVMAVLAAILLLLAGAAADAIAITDPLAPHLQPQLGRVGTWTAVALFGLGGVLAGRVGRDAPEVTGQS